MLRLSIIAAVLAGITCGAPTSMCACSPLPPTQITVYGNVTRHNQPVRSAAIHVFAALQGCDGNQQIVGSAPLLPMTDANGSYRAQLLLIEPSDSFCMRVTAIDRSRAPMDSAMVVRRPVAARSSDVSVPADSMRVDVTMDQHE